MIDLDRVLQKVEDAANRGLFEASEHVLAEARDHVPVEDSTLARSGTTSQDRSTLTAAVSFDTPYAVKQHEDLELEHDAGRTAKFLENALNSERRQVAEIIAENIRREFRG